MDVAIWALILLMAFTGFFLVIGGFGGMLYLLWQRGKENPAASSGSGSGAGSEPEGSGQ